MSLTLAAALAASPSAGRAAVTTLGSDLVAPAALSDPHPVDTLYWQTALGVGTGADIRSAGQITQVRLKGCAQPSTSGIPPLTHGAARRSKRGGRADLGHARFRIPSHRTARVKVRLTKRGRTVLARHGGHLGVLLVVGAGPGGSNNNNTTTRITLTGHPR